MIIADNINCVRFCAIGRVHIKFKTGACSVRPTWSVRAVIPSLHLRDRRRKVHIFTKGSQINVALIKIISTRLSPLPRQGDRASWCARLRWDVLELCAKIGGRVFALSSRIITRVSQGGGAPPTLASARPCPSGRDATRSTSALRRFPWNTDLHWGVLELCAKNGGGVFPRSRAAGAQTLTMDTK